jgi:hypothetical protein
MAAAGYYNETVHWFQDLLGNYVRPPSLLIETIRAALYHTQYVICMLAN